MSAEVYCKYFTAFDNGDGKPSTPFCSFTYGICPVRDSGGNVTCSRYTPKEASVIYKDVADEAD